MSKLNSEQFKSVITECIKDNDTLTKIFDLSSSVSTEEDDETSMSSDEDLPAPSPTRGFDFQRVLKLQNNYFYSQFQQTHQDLQTTNPTIGTSS